MSKTWNRNIQFPSDSDFVVRITDANFGPSKSSGHPMLTLEWEIVSPSEKEIGGDMYEMAGISSNPMNHLYWKTKDLNDEAKSANALERLVSKGDPQGVLRTMLPEMSDLVDAFNPENPSQEILDALKGLCVFVQMAPDIVPQRKNPTSVQIAEAKKTGKRAEGDIQKHPISGKPLVEYRPKVKEIFGVAPKEVGAGKPY